MVIISPVPELSLLAPYIGVELRRAKGKFRISCMRMHRNLPVSSLGARFGDKGIGFDNL